MLNPILLPAMSVPYKRRIQATKKLLDHRLKPNNAAKKRRIKS
jgi:hypothetical protein